jgi:hypothetical protein
LQLLGSHTLDDLFLQFFRPLLDTKLELILGPLERHVTFLDSLQHLVE